MKSRGDDGIVVVMSNREADIREAAWLMGEVQVLTHQLAVQARGLVAMIQQVIDARPEYSPPQLTTGGAMVVREVPDSPLGLALRVQEIERRLPTLATRVELESVRDEVRMMADGMAATNERVLRVADLLKRYGP